MTGGYVAGVGAALPSRALTSADLEESLGLARGWIAGRTGIESRRIAGPSDTACTLGIAAARDALRDAAVEPSDVDYVIVATTTPDFALPAVASLVQAALGCDGGAFDLAAGCSGFLVALAQADALVRAQAARTVLVVGVDLMSRITDYSDPKTGIIFGDGAGAAVVAASDEPSIGPFVLHSDGADPHLLHAPLDATIVMSGREVYRRAVQEMTASVTEVAELSGISVADVDLVVAHQANGRILSAVAERLGVDDRKVFTNIARYGNTSAASIPLALRDAETSGALRDGDVVVVTAFGAGFVWGAGVVRWGPPATAARKTSAAGAARA